MFVVHCIATHGFVAKAAAAFLKALWAYAMAKLEGTLGNKRTQDGQN